jgi:hypothetical protein
MKEMIAAIISHARSQSTSVPSRKEIQRAMAEIRSQWSPQTCAVRAAIASHRSQLLLESICSGAIRRKCG